MALITCPECNKEVSDRAEVCIHCGFPIKEILGNTNTNKIALIICPECNKEVSDGAEVCIHCGFPIKENLENTNTNKTAQWEKRLELAKRMNDADKINELIRLGDEGCTTGYINAGVHYANIGDYENAFRYYNKAYELEPSNRHVLNNMGHLYTRNQFSKFNPDLAIEFFKKSNLDVAHFNLGCLYDGLYAGCEKYINRDLAFDHYVIALNADYIDCYLFNNLGVLYGDKHHNYVVAASFCFLALKMGNTTAEQNYKIFMERVKQTCGPIWERHINALKSHTEIDPMINRVNDMIAQAGAQIPY